MSWGLWGPFNKCDSLPWPAWSLPMAEGASGQKSSAILAPRGEHLVQPHSPVISPLGMGQWAQKQKKFVLTVPNSSQDCSLNMLTRAYWFICASYWDLQDDLRCLAQNVVGRRHPKIATEKAAQMSEFWSRVNCKYGSSSLQIFWDFQWFHVVHPRLQQPDISTAVFLKFWDYFCLFLGLSFSLLRVFLTATSKYIY